MKKIISTLILLIICLVEVTYASEIVYVNSDGHVNFEDENVFLFPVTTDVIKKTTKMLSEITVVYYNGIIKTLYIDKNGKIKKVENSQNVNSNTPIDNEKNAEFQKHIADAPKILVNTRRIIRKCGYKHRDDSLKNKKEYLKIELLDGDYVIAYKAAEYLAEYHKNGELMGLVKGENITQSDKRITCVYYEYRLGYNTEDDEAEEDDMGLKHIMFLDIEHNKSISQYIYNKEGKLLCSQTNNTIYVAEEGRNLIPDWSKKISNKTQIQVNKYETESRKLLRNTFIIVTTPTWVVPPLGLVFFTIGNFIGGKESLKNNK